jgi:hypothetical protein
MAWRNPHPAAPADPEITRLLRGIAQQRAASTTTARGRIALDDLVAEIEARLTRLAHRKDAASHAA